MVRLEGEATLRQRTAISRLCDATGNPMFGQILQRMDDAIVACDPSAAEAALNTIIDRLALTDLGWP